MQTLSRIPEPVDIIPITEEDEVDPLTEAFGPELTILREQIRRVAPQDTSLLLTGETGTGKTRLARYIHDHSPRCEEPFLVLDCGALSATLIESEMFGHVKGAFTGADRDRPGKFAAAGRGTLLLDEVNSLPLPLQGKLLRAVDERLFEPVGANKSLPLHARLIAVSNVPLEEEVAAQRFRPDLYYRLNVVAFHLPPLRDRRTALAPLARRFVAEFVRRNRPDIQGISGQAMHLLLEYDWPGNIRELRNVLERAVALSPGPVLTPNDLPEAIRDHVPSAAPAPGTGAAGPQTLSQAKEAAEMDQIRRALEKHGNNRLRAAEELGISRMGLYKKLAKYKMK